MSAHFQIQVDYNHTAFTPGDTISGKLQWTPTSDAKTVGFRLFWYTSGKGTQDIEVIEELEWPANQGEGSFAFTLPNSPYSFSGTLVSLIWALEAVLLPDQESESYVFQLTPDGREIHLQPVENSQVGGGKKKWFRQR
ncbi:hypothetical protein HW115_05770 [Verrucomicrobiaceae bacterium N1E253]|uniref:Uncharacterized protein n=1 Tax=Oceaniferula marina TaxID=2748318 RepID=A0A851GBI7_9BACT|nr:hypothetical protein [Oceaniferula marina]NWK55108.1 hypothetical protein [Oceaniferula marina]